MRKKNENRGGSATEKYTQERKAEFLLSNSIGRAEYRQMRREVRKMGLNPNSIRHESK